jgi:hypothetical protein
MPVTDDQVAGLRALLFADLDRAEAKKGYTVLATAAFATAVKRRFGFSGQ